MSEDPSFDPAALTLSTFFKVGTISFLIVIGQDLLEDVFDVPLLLIVLIIGGILLMVYALSLLKV